PDVVGEALKVVRAAGVEIEAVEHDLGGARYLRTGEILPDAELEELTGEGRIDIARKIEAARALGDLSENGDYHAAKDAQGQMEARIRQLEATLESAEIVERSGGDEVATGTVVTIRYDGDDATERYLVGSIEERRSDVAVVSPASPLGLALLGHRKGDVVEYQAPGGNLKVEVVEIEV
ncbi:MAG TPA: GreA/GreB family elongation factor, partial [Acidimicrobiales bacterium]|nr:GreA/GreB family elongation factor [Acidimicrobiales bacterium]